MRNFLYTVLIAWLGAKLTTLTCWLGRKSSSAVTPAPIISDIPFAPFIETSSFLAS